MASKRKNLSEDIEEEDNQDNQIEEPSKKKKHKRKRARFADENDYPPIDLSQSEIGLVI